MQDKNIIDDLDILVDETNDIDKTEYYPEVNEVIGSRIPEEEEINKMEENDILNKSDKKEKKNIITIDIDPKEVLNLNDKDEILIFESEPGKFLRLSDEVISRLNSVNKTKYWAAFGQYNAEIEQQKNKQTEKLKILPQLATATKRQDVYNKDPRFHYCWKRPDEVDGCKTIGYVIANDAELKTFGRTASGTPVVGLAGIEELVLMKIPVELYEAMLKRDGDESIRRDEGIIPAAADKMRKMGGQPFEPANKSKLQWS
jgi:hypothetical protein